MLDKLEVHATAESPPPTSTIERWATRACIPFSNRQAFSQTIREGIEFSALLVSEGEVVPVSRLCQRGINQVSSEIANVASLADRLMVALSKIEASGVFSYLDDQKLGQRLHNYEKALQDMAAEAKNAVEAIDERLLEFLRRPAGAPSRKFESPDCPVERRVAGLFYEIVRRHDGYLDVNKNLSRQPECAGTFPAFIFELKPFLPHTLDFRRLSAGAFADIKLQIDKSLGKKTKRSAVHHLISQTSS